MTAGSVLEVSSHVDATESPDLDLQLSQKRGDAVKDYLVNSGAQAEKIQVIANGSGAPIIPNIGKKSREMNRRIEIKLR